MQAQLIAIADYAHSVHTNMRQCSFAWGEKGASVGQIQIKGPTWSINVAIGLTSTYTVSVLYDNRLISV